MVTNRICMIALGHLCIVSLALAQANQTSFSSADIATYERLVSVAVERDSAVLQARVELQQAQLNESLAGLLSQAVSIDMAVGTSTTTFEQAKPNYSASLSLDVTKLLTPRVSTVEAKQAALDAQVRQLRVRVMQAFTNYKVALVAAQNAASVVESRLKQLEISKLQVKAGALAPGELLRAQDAVNDAQVALYKANGDLLVTKLQLAQVVGVELEDLNALLKGEVPPGLKKTPQKSS